MIRISRRSFLLSALLAGCASPGKPRARVGSTLPWIGYTEYRTNLPTRFDNQVTSRACIVRGDGTDRRPIASELATGPHTWTQFAGWSPDGASAIVLSGWESPENAAWEEEHRTFRMTEGWKVDLHLYDLRDRSLVSLTAVERVSDYNSGLVYVPGESDELMFTALIGGVSRPFLMRRDGSNKRDISQGKDGFTYGVSASPDGRRVAYHRDYQIVVADADGSNMLPIETGNPFNFVPQWSPDGAWLLFVSGEHYNCHPYVVRPDGTGLRKVADRGGYTGVMTVYDVFDFHGGSSDVPVWNARGDGIYFTCSVGESIELMHATLEGSVTRLSHSTPGTAHYHPKPSPDGSGLAFGSTRSGNRQLYAARPGGADVRVITQVPAGHGAMWAHWQPRIVDITSGRRPRSANSHTVD